MMDRDEMVSRLDFMSRYFEARGDMAVGDGKLLLLACANAAREAAALVKARPPRVMTLEEIEDGVGNGWIEEWYPADEEEGTAEYWELLPCAWCHGGVVQTDEFGSVDMTTPEMLKTHYGKRYGLRIWDQYPTGEWGRPWDE